MSLENLNELARMTLNGESLREEELEQEGEKFEWRADILTHENFTEIEMMYVFQDPQEELFEQLHNSETEYEPEITDSTYYPSIDHHDGETLVLAYIPIKQTLEHEIAEFPAQYLEELRDGFYEQAISRE